MSRVSLDVAGTRIAVQVDRSTGRLEERYGAFATQARTAGWTFALRAGPPTLGRLTGRAVRRGGLVVVEGAEAMGSLDPVSRRAEVVADPSLVAVDGLLRAAVTLDVLGRGGCLFHAAATVVDGRAHLFPGRSGSGKSTLASLARLALSDEVCAVVPGPEGLRVHGTPWWTGRPGSAQLAGVYALAWHAEGVSLLPRAAGLRHLAANLTLGVDEPATRRAAFAAAGLVAASAPFYRLSFTPSSDVDALLRRPRRAA